MTFLTVNSEKHLLKHLKIKSVTTYCSTLSKSKSPRINCGGFCVTGNNLSSQAASSPVLSTRGSLTAVFGMGTGGASQPSSPDSEPSFCVPASSSLRLACSTYSSMPSRRSLAFPRGLHKNPGSTGWSFPPSASSACGSLGRYTPVSSPVAPLVFLA